MWTKTKSSSQGVVFRIYTQKRKLFFVQNQIIWCNWPLFLRNVHRVLSTFYCVTFFWGVALFIKHHKVCNGVHQTWLYCVTYVYVLFYRVAYVYLLFSVSYLDFLIAGSVIWPTDVLICCIITLSNYLHFILCLNFFRKTYAFMILNNITNYACSSIYFEGQVYSFL